MIYIPVLLAVLFLAADALLLWLPPFKFNGRELLKYWLWAAAANLWLLASMGPAAPFALMQISYFGLVNGLVLLAITDWRQKEVYNLHLGALLLLGGLSALWQTESKFWLLYLNFAVWLAVLLVVANKRTDLGLGDAKMIACLALYFPFTQWLEVMMLAFGTSLLFGLAGLVLKKLSLRTEFAFMPFLLLGVLLEMTR